jgi:pilus assembly protein Flp/PilA
MKNIASKLYVAIKGLMKEEGQDLVEYALVVALIAFAATAGMHTLATNINTVFANLGASMTAE